MINYKYLKYNLLRYTIITEKDNRKGAENKNAWEF